jgi:DNA repair photolyase
MYPWVTHTWNTVKGECEHNCEYCYMKVYKLNPVRFDESELKTDLQCENVIFVGSSCDMWSWNIPDEWIYKTLDHCKKYILNEYLFQSKNPDRFRKFFGHFPKSIFGTTIESNKHKLVEKYSEAPLTFERYVSISELGKHDRVMVSIEPIMDFDLKEFLGWFYDIEPEFISIGADSKGHNLPEPSKEKTLELIKELKEITEVKVKNNLKRIIN